MKKDILTVVFFLALTGILFGLGSFLNMTKITNQDAMKVLDRYFIDVVCPNCEGSGEVEPPPYYTEEYRKTHKFKCPMCTEMGSGEPGM